MRKLNRWMIWTATASSFLFANSNNIYWDDLLTRSPANRDQMRWGVNLGYCSGVMLNPHYLLTAGHCLPQVGAHYTSGACQSFGCRDDLRVRAVVEIATDPDYAIAEVEWQDDSAWHFQNYVEKIARQPGDYAVGINVYTVGFPVDKPGPQYAKGQITKIEAGKLKYNIGTINGNSGGPILREQDGALLGLTNSGPKEFGEPGWDKAEPDNPWHWNSGPRLDQVREKSPLLQKLFP